MAELIISPSGFISYDASATAHKCVRLINEYWRERGFRVNARIDPTPIMVGGKIYQWPTIKSDTLNGSPVV